MVTATLGLSPGPFSTFSALNSQHLMIAQTDRRTDLPDNIHTLGDLAEDDVTTIEPAGNNSRNEL